MKKAKSQKKLFEITSSLNSNDNQGYHEEISCLDSPVVIVNDDNIITSSASSPPLLMMDSQG
jgi:hypothetical protein